MKVNYKFFAVILAFIAAVQVSFVSCSDDPGVGNYYTSTKEYAADYLKNRQQYSEFLKILSRATGERGDLRLVELLGTYGSYTVFAPTNDVVNEYLKSRGLTSVDELSKEDCDTIALNSIIEQAYFTTDFSFASVEGDTLPPVYTFPKSNMLEHVMTVTCDSLKDEAGEVTLELRLNDESAFVHADDSVCNGVVHTVNTVASTSNDLLPAVLEKDESIKIYTEALRACGLYEIVGQYLDETYKWKNDQDRIDSCTWTNNKLCIFTAAEYDNVAYPEKRYFNYTAFFVKDDILKEKYGVTRALRPKEGEKMDDPDVFTLEDLAHQIYDEVYPEDAKITDLHDRRNALNRFISYHIIDRYGSTYTLTANDNCKLQNHFNRRKHDISDWYQTIMPHSLLKFSFPNGTQAGLYLNRRGVQSKADARGVFIRGAKCISEASKKPINGNYFYIDDIVKYDLETQQKLFREERMRFDCSVLSPDFMTKLSDGETARGHSCVVSADNGRYGLGGQGATASSNVNHCIGFKAGFCRNFEYTDNTHIHVRMRVLDFWSYQGDEVTIKGPFDITLTLPPVPEGTYEVRMMTCVGFTSRGILQAYIDGIPQGIPFDMRPGGVELFGYQSDESLGDDDAIAGFDKSIHNNGWMKGPGEYCSGAGKESFSEPSFRNQDNTIRKVLGTFYSDGKNDNYLRLQQKMESGGEMNFDFIEICPVAVYNNEYFSEDTY